MILQVLLGGYDVMVEYDEASLSKQKHGLDKAQEWSETQWVSE